MMDLISSIRQTRDQVQTELSDETTGHDWWHTERVWKLARKLAEIEAADVHVVELAALLHDICDWKFTGDEEAGARYANQWLKSINVSAPIIDRVCAIISVVSFKGEASSDEVISLEAKVVQDADRLDALGAIGIARTFAYGGSVGRPLHDPTVAPRQYMSKEEYKTHHGTTINHFYEKLLLLKDRMHTDTAKQLAEERHQFMKIFLSRFFDEWEGTL